VVQARRAEMESSFAHLRVNEQDHALVRQVFVGALRVSLVQWR
jgi:hypothetical protein